VALTVVNRALSDVVLRLQTEVGKLYAISVVGLQSIETLKATGTEGDFFAKWTGHQRPNAQLRATPVGLPAGQQSGSAVRIEPDRGRRSRCPAPCRSSTGR